MTFKKKKGGGRNLNTEALIEGNTCEDTGRILPISQGMPEATRN